MSRIDIRWVAMMKVVTNSLIDDMEEEAIAWHKEGRCRCMRGQMVTVDNYIACSHLIDFQWEKNKKRIKSIEKKFIHSCKMQLISSLPNHERIKLK